jgi:hypothetical protein
MFKHPFLKGRRPSKKKPLSFIFEDDTVDPNQVTLEEAIEESTKEIETAVNGLADVNKSIVDMLGPTDETPEETIKEAAESLTQEVEWAAENKDGEKIELDQDAQDTLNHAFDNMVNEDGETLRETFDKELKEELEVEDDTFEL